MKYQLRLTSGKFFKTAASLFKTGNREEARLSALIGETMAR